MRTQSEDTHPDIERVQIEMLRKASISDHYKIVAAWSEFIREIAKEGIRRDYPEASEEEVNLTLVGRLYGEELEKKVRAYLAQRRQT